MRRAFAPLAIAGMLGGAVAEDKADILAVTAPYPPTIDRSDATILRYELLVANRSGAPVVLVALEFTDAAGRRLGALSEAALASAQARDDDDTASPVLPPRGTTKLYIDIALGAQPPPAMLVHALRFAAPGPGAVPRQRVSQVAVDRAEPVAIGPPLRGGPWIAVHDPFWARGHRRMVYMEGGRARIPGRYAIDFVGVDHAGAITSGDPDRPADAIGYGAEVIAVADGTVTRVRDDMTEGGSIAADGIHKTGEAAGNHLVLKMAERRYAFYEHLKPGSIAVQVGQRVRRGDVIGALGFTGNSTGPHLHFHVADAPTPLGGEGLPFTIDRFVRCGRYADLGGLGREPWQRETPQVITRRRPGGNVVVVF